MKVTYSKSTFVNDTEPNLSEEEMNKITTGIDDLVAALEDIRIDSAEFNAGSSTAANYAITSYRGSAPSAGEVPMAILILPTITNSAGLTITPSWDSTARQVWDMSTNAQVIASVIKENQPVMVAFDGTKFWVNGGGNYLQYSASPSNGYFNKGTVAPSGTARNNFEGYLYATKFFGAVWNESAADFAEGYPVEGECEFGDLIMINKLGKYEINNIDANSKIIGIVSKEGQYGAFFGTNYGSTPVAICGRVFAKIDGKCEAGDFLVAGSEAGTLKSCDGDTAPRMSICAMALESKDTLDVDRVLVNIVRG